MGAVFVPGIVKAMSSAGRLLMTPVRPPMTSNFKLTEAAAPATRFTVQVFPPGALLAVSVRSPVPSLKAMRAADGVDGALLYSKNTTPRKLPVTTLTWSAWTLVASPVAVLMLPPPCAWISTAVEFWLWTIWICLSAHMPRCSIFLVAVTVPMFPPTVWAGDSRPAGMIVIVAAILPVIVAAVTFTMLPL